MPGRRVRTRPAGLPPVRPSDAHQGRELGAVPGGRAEQGLARLGPPQVQVGRVEGPDHRAQLPLLRAEREIHQLTRQPSSRAAARPVSTTSPRWFTVRTDSTDAVAVSVSPGHTWATKRTPYSVSRCSPTQS